jgi:multidrug efflux pump subunit AcrA (membrane-fusion protein)
MSPSVARSLRIAFKLGLFAGILFAGWSAYQYLASSRKDPRRQEPPAPTALVQVVRAQPAEGHAIIDAMGTVVPARQASLLPEVSGRVLQVHPALVPGGRVRAGEALVVIDPRDYDLAIRREQARVKAAELDLAREQGLKSVAEREWKLIRDEVQPTEEGRRLALRELQVENSQVALAAAHAGLEQAELVRGRTVIRAPWNAVVTEEAVEVGQVVSPGYKLASLVGSDAFWVRTAVPMDRLGWLQLPDGAGQPGSPARVLQPSALNGPLTRPGRVIGLMADLDPRGRMARVLVEVPEPLSPPPREGSIQGPDNPEAGVRPGGPSAVPLLLGAYAQVHIEGPPLQGALALPTKALRDQDKVWVVGQDGKLEFRQVRLLWSRADEVVVAGELAPGEAVVTSRLATPVEGMSLAVEDEAPAPRAADGGPARPAGGTGEKAL